MPSPSAFPITRRWPAQHPDRLQLYSLNTRNGMKVSIMLEEIGLPYEPHLVDFNTNGRLLPKRINLRDPPAKCGPAGLGPYRLPDPALIQ
jgi:GST-like protein